MVHRKSYWKTITLALAMSIVGLLGLMVLHISDVSEMFGTAASSLLIVLTVVAALIAVGGFVCLWRDRRIELGLKDPIGASLLRTPSQGLLSKLGLRSLLGRAPRPGDLVTIRPLDEILSTLDADAALDGLPFMPEMKEFCGRTFQVHRRVDKIYDMRNKTGMRRLRNAVTLTALRCNGVHHDGCQAECHILWKDAWLQRQPANMAVSAQAQNNVRIAPDTIKTEQDTYICQMTRLWEASQPMSRFDFRQDLRPLLSGNVTLWAYVIVLLTRLFNTAQRLRKGAGFPCMPSVAQDNSATQGSLSNLSIGQKVKIKSREQISLTLVNGKTKGLWYDRDMIRFSGNHAVVYKKVDRLIHEGTGKMVKIKTPCWILQDITATGEFQRLNPQKEYTYWREAWLQQLEVNKEGTAIN